MSSKRNVFIVGLTDFHRHALQSVSTLHDCQFFSLLSYKEAIRDHLPFNELLIRARTQLGEFDGSVDAIISQWDFPTSCLVPVLCAERGIPAPSLESVLKCEHKYWARLEQAKVVPECVPRFQVVDPFDPQAAARIILDYPFWLKPVKSFSSGLGFRIDSRAEFESVLPTIRAHIGELGRGFDEALAQIDLPPEVQGIGGLHCIAEELISGVQAAPEGHAFGGEVYVHGSFDMIRDDNGMSFSHLQYPCALPASVQARMHEVSKRVLRQVGFDQGCFNVEFMWDPVSDRLGLIEVNTRMSQSHAELFLKVDGMSNHAIAISLALRQRPRFPHRRGTYPLAAKFWVNKYGDATVLRVPTRQEVLTAQRTLPGEPQINIAVSEGERLSELPNQDAYRYVVAEVYLGGQSEADLLANYQLCLEHLPFEFSNDAPLWSSHAYDQRVSTPRP